MYSDYRSMMRGALDIRGHLNELSTCLRNLSARLRESVAEAVGSSVGRAVQDGLARLLDRSNRPEYRPSREERCFDPDRRRFDSDDWSQAVDENGWEVDEPQMPESRPSPATSTPTNPSPIQKAQLLALMLKATSGWLMRRGSAWRGAVGVGLLIGGLAAIGGPIAAAGIGIVEAAADLLMLNNLIMTGADLNAA
jgi:hypothetical protein